MTDRSTIRWKELLSLIYLNISVSISWIAYHEYQSVLLNNFGLNDLAFITVVAKSLILLLVPILVGYYMDFSKFKSKNKFLIYTLGIIIASLTFMLVATIISFPVNEFSKLILPVMIVIWLISMNIFYSPANSLIEYFAPDNLRVRIVALLVFSSEIIFALEPLVIDLVQFLGAGLTFVTGGVLVSSSGYLFAKFSSDEISEKSNIQDSKKASMKSYLILVFSGLIAGLAHSLLISYIPNSFAELLPFQLSPSYYSFTFLGLSAVFCLLFVLLNDKIEIELVLKSSMILILMSLILIVFNPDQTTILISSILLSISFSAIVVNGLPFLFNNFNRTKMTLYVGLFYGLNEVFDGIMEIYFF